MRIINPFRFEDLQCGDPVWSGGHGYGELEPVEHSTGKRVVNFHNGKKRNYHCQGRFGYELEDEKSLAWPALTFEIDGYVIRDNGDIYRVRSVVGDKGSLYPIIVFPVSGGSGGDMAITPSGHYIADECGKGCFWPIERGCYPEFYVGMPVIQVNTKKVGRVCDDVTEHGEVCFPVGVRWDDGGPKEWFTMNGQGIEDGPRVIFPLEQPERIPQSCGVNDNNRGKSMISTDLKSIANEVEIGFWRGVGEKLPSILLSQGPRILSAIAREYGGKGNSETDASAEIVKKLVNHPAISKILEDLDKQ